MLRPLVTEVSTSTRRETGGSAFIMLLWFITPVTLTGWEQLFLLLPLCLAVAIVYKATKLEDMREVPLASLSTWVSIVVGMFAVGIGLYALHWMMA